MVKRWREIGGRLVAVLVGLTLAACGRHETAVDASIATQTLHVGSAGEPSELDPHVINAPPDFKIVPMLFEGLLTGDPATLEPRPGVASSWELSADRRTYTFHLRPEARWSNGDALTSADFLYSWQRALTPALGSQYTFLLSAVVGADDFSAGRVSDFSTVGFAAPDAATVTITLIQPTPYFLGNLANNPIWAPVHRATIEAAGGMAARGSGWTKPETFVGNGAFVLREWRPNEIIRLEKSPLYWDAGHVRLEALVYHTFDNFDTEERAYRAGQLHVTAKLPVAKLPAYRAMADSPLHEVNSLIDRYININTTRPPFDDARVRRAFALAIDRDLIAKAVYNDLIAPARGVVPTGMPGYHATDLFSDDALQAKALLAAAGLAEGAGFPAFELSVESGASNNLAEALQARWREVLGVRVDIVRTETRVHWSRLQQKDYTLSIGGWIADYPDATAMLDLWKGESGWNFTGWTSSAYDALLAEAAAASDEDARRAKLHAAEALLMAEMPVIPVGFERNPRLVRPEVRNLQDNALDRPDFRYVYLEAETGK